MLKCYHNRQALLKKNQLTEDNYKQKVFLLHKWDFLKQIKATLIQEKQKKAQKRQAAETMVLLTKMVAFLLRIAKDYNNKKEEVCWRERSRWVAFLTHKYMQRHFRRRGATLERRIHTTLRIVILSHYNMLHDQVIQTRSKQVVVRALKCIIIGGTFSGRLRDSFFQIEFIQRKFRATREGMKRRSLALRYSILLKQTFLINNSLLKSGKEDNKRISIKIN